MDHIMNFNEYLVESNSSQPSEAELDAAAKQIGMKIAKMLADTSIGRSYARQSIKANGPTWVKAEFEGGPMEKLKEKGITPRKVSKKAQEYAYEFFKEMVGRGEGRDS